jgi:hypothetical protein
MIGPTELAFIIGIVIIAIVGSSIRDRFVKYVNDDDKERPS